jgi:UDP-N-acetylglucosamine 2-epimerase
MSVDAAVVVGTRPEAIKMAPVVFSLREAGLGVLLIGSGQHRELLDEALTAFGLTADVDLKVMREDQDLPGLTSRLVTSLAGALGAG